MSEFVEHLKSDRSVPVGMSQGKYNIIMDPYSQRHITLRVQMHPKRDFDHRFIPLPAKEARLPTEKFELSVQELVENGWNGKPIPGTSLERLERINIKSTSTSETSTLEKR